MFWVEGGTGTMRIILSIFCSDKDLVPELSSQAKEAVPGIMRREQDEVFRLLALRLILKC